MRLSNNAKTINEVAIYRLFFVVRSSFKLYSALNSALGSTYSHTNSGNADPKGFLFIGVKMPTAILVDGVFFIKLSHQENHNLMTRMW